MENIIIDKINHSYYVVIATTERFGKDEIMYEGISLRECFNFLAKNNSQHTHIGFRNLNSSEIVYRLHELIDKISKKINCSITSAGKITDSSRGTKLYEIAQKTVKNTTHKWANKIPIEEMSTILLLLNGRLHNLNIDIKGVDFNGMETSQ